MKKTGHNVAAYSIINSITKHWHLILYALLTISLGLYLPFLFQISLYIVAGLTWALYIKKHKGKGRDISSWWLFVALAAVLFTRIYPFISGHPAPLGYDTGIYKYEFEQAIRNLPGFAMAIHPGLFFFSDFLHFFGIDSDFLIREGYIIINLLIPLMIYATVKEFFGKNAGILAALVFAFSSLQFNAYTYVLYKNALGLSVLLFSLILINRRSYFLLPIGLFLAILQPTHFLLLGLTLFILWIINWKDKKDRKYFFLNGIFIGAGAISVFLINPGLIDTAIQIIQRKDPLSEGVFLRIPQGVDLMSIYFPVALIGFIHLLKKRKCKPLLVISVITALIVFFKIFFYQRYFIELDIFIIILAGIGLSQLIPKIFAKIHFKSIFLIIFLLFITLNLAYVNNYESFASKNEVKKMQALCFMTEENAIVMVTHSYYSPWVRGFSCRDTYAPGLFEHNKWSEDEWEEFWDGSKDARYKMMKETFTDGRPVYVFIGEKQPQYDFTGIDGFEKLDIHLWKFQ